MSGKHCASSQTVRRRNFSLCGVWLAVGLVAHAPARAGTVVPGEPLAEQEKGPSIVETWEAMEAREAAGEGQHEGTITIVPNMPIDLPGAAPQEEEVSSPFGTAEPGLGIEAPNLVFDFRGPNLFDSGSIPPDTMGAVGPNHFMVVINGNVSIYSKSTGGRLSSVSLANFWAGVFSFGPFDPRVLYDQHSGRWVTMAADGTSAGNSNVLIAVSATGDPRGSWFKTKILASMGVDAGRWCDYPTLGVSSTGIFVAGNMFGTSTRVTVWVFDKAPMIASPPSLGTVTAFRNISSGFSLQPAHTFGLPPAEYIASASGSGQIRIYTVTGAMTSPTFTDTGVAFVDGYSAPPDAPASGSTTPIDTSDGRLMMSLYRDGSLWTCHAIASGGRAACRWYEINPATRTRLQSGTVADLTRAYFYPSIMVNSQGHAVMGFSGVAPTEFVGCYYTGRLASDPPGFMDAPELLKAGESSYTRLDGVGRNRWGDYSYTTLDPTDELTLWTIQEYAASPANTWGTWIGVLQPVVTFEQRIYFTDHANSNKIRRARLDGTAVQTVVLTTLPIGIALDLSESRMYWVDRSVDDIVRASLTGTSIETLYNAPGFRQGLAVSPADAKMYWTDTENLVIQRANFDGTDVETLVNTSPEAPNGIALDLVSGKMYFTAFGTADRIQRANLDGSNLEDLVTTNLSTPEDLALDLIAGRFYWTDSGTQTIRRANLDGSNVQTLVTTGLSQPRGIALNLEAGKMYWTDTGNDTIKRADLSGANIQTLISTGLALNERLALDTSNHWIAAGGGWSNGANWTNGTPPANGSNEPAILDAAGTYTVTGPATPTTIGFLGVGSPAGGSPTLALATDLTTRSGVRVISGGQLAVSGNASLLGGPVGVDGSLELADAATLNVSNRLRIGDALDLVGSAVCTVGGDLSVGANGVLTADAASLLALGGDLDNASMQAVGFDLSAATLRLNGQTGAADPQRLEVPGADLGATEAGFADNFAIGTLHVTASGTVVHLADDHDNAPAATGGGPPGDPLRGGSRGAEAIYADHVDLDAGITLKLNGWNIYYRTLAQDPTAVVDTSAGGALIQVGGALPGDFDGDGDVDLSDFVTFQLCFGGSNNPPAPTCPPGINADLDGDGDVDLADFLIFQQNFTGSL